MKRFLTLLFILPPVLSHATCKDVQLRHSVDHQQLWQDIEYLASDALEGRKTRSEGSLLAQDFIAKRFSDLKLRHLPGQTQYTIPFSYEMTFSSVEGVNVAGYLPGTDYLERFIVVTAHYDHLGKKGRDTFSGADDNASGVAAMLALASAIQATPLRHSVVFLATDAEEKGLIGSKAFLADDWLGKDDIKFNLNLDMLAQGGRRHRLYASSSKLDSRLDDLIEDTIIEAGLCLVKGHRSSQRSYASPSRRNWKQASDHGSFADAGIPYVYIGVSDHPDYHTPKDIVENIRPEFFYAATETSLLFLQKLDALPVSSD